MARQSEHPELSGAGTSWGWVRWEQGMGTSKSPSVRTDGRVLTFLLAGGAPVSPQTDPRAAASGVRLLAVAQEAVVEHRGGDAADHRREEVHRPHRERAGDQHRPDRPSRVDGAAGERSS